MMLYKVIKKQLNLTKIMQMPITTLEVFLENKKKPLLQLKTMKKLSSLNPIM
jgi:hypothetical protein